MHQRIRTHLTYANVISTLALLLVLTGGVAYAANTVLSSDIVNNQVYSADVRNDTLTGGGLTAADLRAASVGPSEIKAGAVRSQKIGSNQVGGKALATINYRSSARTNIPVNDSKYVEASCDQGEQVLGGGNGATWTDPGIQIIASYASDGGGWVVIAYNPGPGAATITVYADCLAP
jgi:hypothetical protein